MRLPSARRRKRPSWPSPWSAWRSHAPCRRPWYGRGPPASPTLRRRASHAGSACRRLRPGLMAEAVFPAAQDPISLVSPLTTANGAPTPFILNAVSEIHFGAGRAAVLAADVAAVAPGAARVLLV